MQQDKPIAFHSQALKGRNLGLSTYERELLALVIAVKRSRAYLVGSPFIVRINQQSLKYILEQKISNPTQQKWFAKLLGYAFVVQYKKDKDNLVADAFSKKVETEVDLAAAGPSDMAESAHLNYENELYFQGGVLCMLSFPSPT